MKYLLTILLLVGCSSDRGLYSKAREYPNLDLVVFSSTFDATGDGIMDAYVYGYDLDGDESAAEMWAAHRILSTDGPYYSISARPFMFAWLDKRGNIVGRQYDLDYDGEIESVSGDVKHIVKWLGKINPSCGQTSLDAL